MRNLRRRAVRFSSIASPEERSEFTSEATPKGFACLGLISRATKKPKYQTGFRKSSGKNAISNAISGKRLGRQPGTKKEAAGMSVEGESLPFRKGAL